MKRKILVADDEKMVRVAILGVLAELADAFEVCAEASNGREMVALARKHLPDLFLVDIKMPEMGGLEAIAECRRLVPDAGFLILSGVNDFEDARKALQLGVADYLLKPIRPAELVSAVQDAGARVDEGRRRQADALALRCGQWRQRRGGATEDPYSGWRFSAAFFFLDEPVQVGGPRGEQIRERVRSVLGQRLRTGFLLTLLPGGQASVCVLWGIRSDHPEAERLEAEVRDQLAHLVLPFRSGPCLVTGISLGPLVPLPDLLHQVQTLETDGACRFAFLGDPGLIDWSGVLAQVPSPKLLPVLRYIEGLASSLAAGDVIEFNAHLQGLRRSDVEAWALDPVVPRMRKYLQVVLGVALEADPASWAGALAEKTEGWFGSGVPEGTQAENQVVAQILRKISDECMLEISLKQIAGQLGLSANYISTLFHRHTKTTFVRYLTQVRMDRAALFVKDPQIPLNDIARLCGYANRSYFEKVFSATHGLTPAEYRAIPKPR